jgi:predicted MFS family arabinose efflux permease
VRDTGVLYTPTFWLACAIHFRGGMSFGMFLYTAALDFGETLGTPIGGAIAWAAGYRVMFACMALASVVGLSLMASDQRRVAA